MTYELISTVAFPKYQGDIKVNMMPIIFGDPSSIPAELHGYLPMIEKCTRLTPGKIAYLTIHESLVKAATTQRRPGIHTDGTSTMAWGGYGGGGWGGGGRPQKPAPIPKKPTKPEPTPDEETPTPPTLPGNWGGGGQGAWGGRAKGIYMSSSDGACRVWDAQAMPEEVDSHGSLLRFPVAKSELMKPKGLYWLTDRTPHASQIAWKDTKRQFFRLVSDEVGAWWQQHSTANPLGILPSCLILTHSKFE